MPMHLLKRALFTTLTASAALTGPALLAGVAPVAAPSMPPATTPEALQQRLEGKTLFFRGFYLDDKLHFDTTGKVEGNPAHGSFTLSGIQVRKVKFTKHTMELEADRIGLHFFGAIPYENDAKPYEILKVSSKPIEISIERPVIEPEKKKKKKGKDQDPAAVAKDAKPAVTTEDAREGVAATDDAEGTVTTIADAPAAPSPTTHDPRQSYIALSAAIEKIFSTSLDDSVISTLPDYWQNYFATKAGKPHGTPAEASALHPGPDVRAPHLLTAIDPASNDYAQRNNIAGMILLQTVVGASGKPTQITIVRPIGFGLDERAVEAIQKAQFQPGTTKEGKPVPVVVNLAVTFRIYSDKTRPHPGSTPAAAPTQVAPKETPAPRGPKDGTTTVAAARVDG